MIRKNLQTHQASPLPFPLPPSGNPPKTFHHTIDISLKDSNAYGNTYFSRYFEWQGICREQWYFQCFPFDWLQTLGVLFTKKAHQEYAQETFPFQKVECRLNAYNIKQCSFNLLFRFYVDGKLVSKGYQQIVYANRDKKIVRFPDGMREKIREYEDPQLKFAV
jgi:acyl-CoA thioesterase FadM